jgi:hypothetical protein
MMLFHIFFCERKGERGERTRNDSWQAGMGSQKATSLSIHRIEYPVKRAE